MNVIPLNLYGITIHHPEDWRLFINPNNKITYDEGLVKIDKVTVSKKASTSLSIRWAKMRNDITLDDYIDKLEKEFKRKEKKSRNKDKYRIVDKQKLRLNGREAYLIKNEFVANHSIYRILGKDELVKVLQLIFYSEETKRIGVASLSATPSEMKRNEADFKEILFSFHEDRGYKEMQIHEEQSNIRAFS